MLESADGLNNRRLLAPIGGRAPADAAQRCDPSLDDTATAAYLKLKGLRQTRQVRLD
jgi:hypothetical protein